MASAYCSSTLHALFPYRTRAGAHLLINARSTTAVHLQVLMHVLAVPAGQDKDTEDAGVQRASHHW